MVTLLAKMAKRTLVLLLAPHAVLAICRVPELRGVRFVHNRAATLGRATRRMLKGAIVVAAVTLKASKRTASAVVAPSESQIRKTKEGPSNKA